MAHSPKYYSRSLPRPLAMPDLRDHEVLCIRMTMISAILRKRAPVRSWIVINRDPHYESLKLCDVGKPHGRPTRKGPRIEIAFEKSGHGAPRAYSTRTEIAQWQHHASVLENSD